MKELGYGFFCGGDPRDFVPDSDARPEEVEAWRQACERALFLAAEGGTPDEEAAGQFVATEDGAAHIQRAGFGTGSYLYEVDDE